MTSLPAEREFAALLDVAVDGVIIIDHRGIIETFNRAAETLFGYTAAEAIGMNVSMLMPEPHRSNHNRITIVALKGSPVLLSTYPWVNDKSEFEIEQVLQSSETAT